MSQDLNEKLLKFGEFIKLLDDDEIVAFLTNIQRHHGEFMPLFMSKSFTFKEWYKQAFIWLKTSEGQDFWNAKFIQHAETYNISL